MRQKDFTGSFYTFMPEGCDLCRQGSKLVLFVTGVCRRNCFYCPVSVERKDSDIIYANEHPVNSDADIIEEARTMDALGTGITGGEPLLKPDRVIHYIKLLKETFGSGHHIHLYTASVPGDEILKSLADAGLDEIRFHPVMDRTIDMEGLKGSIINALSFGMDAGIEIPAVQTQNFTETFEKIISLVKETGIFLNLNELEFSDTNAEALLMRGFVLRDDVSNAAAGSEDLIRDIKKSGIKFRFCSSRFKDAVQFRERLKRIAKNMARAFDEATEDGTIVYGVIEGDTENGIGILHDCEVPDDMYMVFPDHIEIGWWIAAELKEELKDNSCKVSVVERYPYKNGTIMEMTPL